MLFTDDLTPYAGSLSPELAQAVEEIKKYFKVDDLKVFQLDKWSIAVAAEYEISLPSRGAVGGLIKEKEPVLIQLSLGNYPDRAPLIRSNRKDFPKANLSHRYYTPPDVPATLCLVRENLDQWFATVTIADLLSVGEQWFYKAATGSLNEDGDEFDPIMLENYRGNHIYKYDTIYEVVQNDQRLLPDLPMAVLLSCNYFNSEESAGTLIFKSIMAVPFIILNEVREKLYEFYRQYNSDEAKADPLFSLLVWDSDHTEEGLYCTSLPNDYGKLKTYLAMRGIGLDQMLAATDRAGLQIKRGLPIIHAIRRPKKVIGYNGNYEFFNFVLLVPETGLKDLKDDSLVIFQKHIEPFSQNLAKALSGESRTNSTLFVGAGSLGSKMIIHDARTGKLNIGVSDQDTMLQHNLARHALYLNSIGTNKAKGIIDVIKGFYTLDSTRNFAAYDNRINVLNDNEIEKYQEIVETTASRQVLQHLTLRHISSSTRYSRCEIVDDGKLGLLYSEGINRNPRMDDLANTAIFFATKDMDLEVWRKNDAQREPTIVNIGLGCSSTTTILPDDVISLHASSFSRVLADDSDRKYSGGKGLIYLSIQNRQNGLMQLGSKSFSIDPFEVLNCEAGSGWTLRIFSGITQQLLNLCTAHQPKETGGVLVGVSNYKTKTIHVFSIVTEPQDSHGTCTGFTRGIKELPEQIDRIKHQTGEAIGYIGEWHTHPMDLEQLSSRDKQTIEELKLINNRVPIPTCAVVVTPKKILPFVFI